MTTKEKNALHEMLIELESSSLVVGLVPCKRFVNEGGCIRVAFEKNAKWYRDFCARFPSSRKRAKKKFDTKIKRKNTLTTLRVMLRGRSFSCYARVFLQIARERIKREKPLTVSANPF